ncbi:MAG: hypothetical protein L3J39_05630 [Verrucomicrobiales bacterium]|nr:hypothetical protein [Verrucomicrobiales bacterium]
MNFSKKPQGVGVLLWVSVLMTPLNLRAHVKWFSDYSYADRPLEFSEVITPVFWSMLTLSLVVIAGLILFEERLGRYSWVQRFDQWLASKKDNAMGVMRVGAAATLVWAWQAGNLLAPELACPYEWMVWLQFVVALLLAFRRTVAVAGVGIILLYVLAIWQFGFFHMLDYLLFPGVGYYFIAGNGKGAMLRRTALPALYATVGFCLIWLGIEKLIYPSWAILLLDEHPVLALGLDHAFFVVAAAFVEISLGFMIMVCLQQRLLAVTISLVFVLTTLVFGRAEVVGHTLIHAVLIVFLIAGAGRATPPLHWIPGTKRRLAAALLAFMVILGTFMVPYYFGAQLSNLEASSQDKGKQAHSRKLIEVDDPGQAPALAISIHKDPVAGWNLELTTENFVFAPAKAGYDPVEGEGHAHLYIDGRKVARLYGVWYHIPRLDPGHHKVVVTLNANNHRGLSVNGKEISESAEIEVVPLAAGLK